MNHLDDDDTAFDLQHDMKMEKQLELEADMKHEARMFMDEDYCLDRYLPEIIIQLEHISQELSKYSHEMCVKMLLNKLEDY